MGDTVTPSDSAEITLATLLQLSRRARQAEKAAELRFILANETHQLVGYRQSAFWSRSQGIETLSGVSTIEPHAPYVQWLERWCSARPEASKAGASSMDLRSLSDSTEWRDWLPCHVLMVELPSRNHFAGGRLLLAREQPFSSAELALLQEWGEAWSASYAALQPARWLPSLRLRRSGDMAPRWWPKLLAMAVVTAVAILPVPLSVLAPAELVPLDPVIVRAPLDGIIEQVLVLPNQRVSKGQPLFEFDRISLRNRLQVAERSLQTIRADYRQKAQRAVFDGDSKAKLAVLQSQIKEQQVEVEYLLQLNDRSLVNAPRDGVVLFDNANAWVGRPVATGERVMVVADESQSQVEAWLSPADMIDFPVQAAVTVYLAADPINPLSARLEYVAHEAIQRPEGNFGYRVRARLEPLEENRSAPRVGLKGTAKIQGRSVALIYWVMRRPWAAFRGWIGV